MLSRSFSPPRNILGYGFVHGVPAHIYLEALTLDALGRLGLAVDHSGRPPDVYIRKPANRRGRFRAQVLATGIPIFDIVQVWIGRMYASRTR